jgi:hypothetical protein
VPLDGVAVSFGPRWCARAGARRWAGAIDGAGAEAGRARARVVLGSRRERGVPGCWQESVLACWSRAVDGVYIASARRFSDRMINVRPAHEGGLE